VRRQTGTVVRELHHGLLRIDVPACTVTLSGEPVKLSAQEFRTLLTLARRSGQVISRSELEQSLYGWNSGIDSNAIEVYIHQLRRKIGAAWIQTVRGFGYLFSEPR
jgi:two-component system, OmpR family, response regulator QseB